MEKEEKTAEEIKKEKKVKAEDKEEELEELKEELKDLKKKKKKRTVGRIISSIIFFLLFAVIIFETVIGIINMQRINDEKDPIWYINKKENITEKKEEITYNLGLYKIVKTDTSKQTKITLKPFFMN